jgi:hypothetical protein
MQRKTVLGSGSGPRIRAVTGATCLPDLHLLLHAQHTLAIRNSYTTSTCGHSVFSIFSRRPISNPLGCFVALTSLKTETSFKFEILRKKKKVGNIEQDLAI